MRCRIERAVQPVDLCRQALNALRAQSRRREQYIGPWLPEPLLTGPDASADVVLAESVSMVRPPVAKTSSVT